jgi:hypothetical protein
VIAVAVRALVQVPVLRPALEAGGVRRADRSVRTTEGLGRGRDIGRGSPVRRLVPSPIRTVTVGSLRGDPPSRRDGSWAGDDLSIATDHRSGISPYPEGEARYPCCDPMIRPFGRPSPRAVCHVPVRTGTVDSLHIGKVWGILCAA